MATLNLLARFKSYEQLPVGLALKTTEGTLHELTASGDVVLQQTMVEVLAGYDADDMLCLEAALYVVYIKLYIANALIWVLEVGHYLIEQRPCLDGESAAADFITGKGGVVDEQALATCLK
jgi:hypothetical protein